ncbi:MAG TPA: cyclic nucleotide-binding domain-containing protein [Chthoniobacterales bacterium]|nr:cyclic nucleotide-binding domain-containing protein [Chthoniobacterales bacterium]
MNVNDLENDIAATPFLAGMSDRHIETLARCACRLRFAPGQIIFSQGETANRFYLVEQGSVELEAAVEGSAHKIKAGIIKSGGVLGWSWLLPPYECLFTARAMTETKALFFYGTMLREYSEADPSLGFELLKRMSAGLVRRLQAARERLVESESRLLSREAEHGTGGSGYFAEKENNHVAQR